MSPAITTLRQAKQKAISMARRYMAGQCGIEDAQACFRYTLAAAQIGMKELGMQDPLTRALRTCHDVMIKGYLLDKNAEGLFNGMYTYGNGEVYANFGEVPCYNTLVSILGEDKCVTR